MNVQCPGCESVHPAERMVRVVLTMLYPNARRVGAEYDICESCAAISDEAIALHNETGESFSLKNGGEK